MFAPFNASLPQAYDLGQSYQVVFCAVDPTTGDAVTGVVVNNASIQAAQVQGTLAALATPNWLPLPLDAQ